MKITKQTIGILQNFSNINKSILVEPGSELKTMSKRERNIVARSGVSEEFTQQFGIYDVKEFLRVLTSPALRGGEIEFGEEYLTLKNGDCESKYVYASEAVLDKPEDVGMSDPEIEFSLDKDKLDFVFGMADILGKPDLAITSDGKTISVVVLNKKDPESSDFSMVVGEGNGDTYTMYLKTENIKVLAGSYDVNITSKGISHFAHQEIDLEYWIATEPDSEFNKSAVVLGDEEPEAEEPVSGERFPPR